MDGIRRTVTECNKQRSKFPELHCSSRMSITPGIVDDKKSAEDEEAEQVCQKTSW